jgi:RHS repeat-associated protein
MRNRGLKCGTLCLETELFPTDRRFTGQRWEANLGLYDYRARFYDPALGRFLQPDPIVPEPGNPQALNRYAYVYNNPLRYTDPSGHAPVILVMMGIGAVSGALINYGVQVAANISQNGLQVQAFTNVNWAAVGASAVAGAVGGATFYGASAVLGTGLWGMVGAGAFSGAVSGQAARATENVLTGKAIGEGLGDPVELGRDAIIGGLSGGIFHGVDRMVMRAAFRGTYVRYISEGELRAIQETGLLRGGRVDKTYFTTDEFESAKEALSHLALKEPPSYRVEFEITSQPRIYGPRRVRPWFWPRDTGFRAGWGVEYWSPDPVLALLLRIERLK